MENKKIGILNKGKDNKSINNSFENFDVGIQDEGEGTVAKGNKFLSLFQKGDIDWTKWSVIVAIILFILGLIANFLQKPSIQQEGVLNTVGQVGDNNLVVNRGITEPIFKIGSLSSLYKNNTDSSFSGSFLIEVASQVVLKNVYFRIPIYSVTNCGVTPAQQGVIRGVSCNAVNDIAYIRLTDAIGLYKVTFSTKTDSLRLSTELPVEYESYSGEMVSSKVSL